VVARRPHTGWRRRPTDTRSSGNQTTLCGLTEAAAVQRTDRAFQDSPGQRQ
jgi:hypothetical protein